MNIGERMIAERQREAAVSITALRMMQEHHGNPYFSFKCVSPDEAKEWRAKAEKLIPPVGGCSPATGKRGPQGTPQDRGDDTAAPATKPLALILAALLLTGCYETVGEKHQREDMERRIQQLERDQAAPSKGSIQ